METFKLDDRVKVIGKNAKGRIAFIGNIHLTEGIMYGIALDKPKGRCSGQIGGVSYFNCPKDHGVFVRECQLEMDDGNLSDYSDNCNGDVIPRPVYPNYLKFSSKINFRKSKHHSKSKELASKVNSPLKKNVRTKQLPGNNQCSDVSKDPGLKVKKRRHLSRKREVKRTSDEEHFLIEKIKTQTQQIDTIRRYLKKLKSYVRWSKGFDSKENQMKTLLDTAIDSVIGNMVEIVGNSEKGNDYDHDHSKGDIGLEKENDILVKCIWDLEKKNETLLACMTKIRGILLNSWKLRSSGKFECDVDRKKTSEKLCPSENAYENYSPKNPKTPSRSDLSSKSQPHLNEILQTGDQTEGETETIKPANQLINLGAKNENQEARSCLDSKNENGLNDNPKTDAQHLSKSEFVRNYLESINNEIEELKKELSGKGGKKSNDKCEEMAGDKPNLAMGNKKSPTSKENHKSNPTNERVLQSPKANSKTKHKTKRHQTNIRYLPYVSDKRLNREQTASNIDTDIIEDEKDPTKELSELISNIMTNMNLNEENEIAPKDSTKELCGLISNLSTNMTSNEQDEMAPKDSSKFKELNTDRPATSLSVVVGKSYSNPESDKFEKVSTPSNKIKSEGILKSRKSVRGGNTSRSKSPKKRIYLKQTMEVGKQPTLHR